MTTAAVSAARAWGTRQHARWLLLLLHVPLVVVSPLFTLAGFQGRPQGSLLAVAPLAGALAGLQLRHILAAARGERPAHWPWTFLALVVVVYLPMWWFTFNWAATQWFVIASAALLLRGRLAVAAVAAPVIVTALVASLVTSAGGDPLPSTVYVFAYWLVIPVIVAGGLVAATQLVRAVDELYEARAELADRAVDEERLRVSRDLHDLLGQSLSAISLKGDLALATLETERPVAEAEIRSLVDVARDALRDIRHVTHGEHAVSLATEARGAAVLLDAASIDARIDADLPGLPRPVDEVLAWATREAVTNILRHSQARWCSITATHHDAMVRLEIVNDGAGPQRPLGNGLTGLAERAASLAGAMSAGPPRDGQFRLAVELPLPAP
jgi:two-component system sensor histidine kinase DesK